jgi:ribonuclease BN (tRNA processing enzyme)
VKVTLLPPSLSLNDPDTPNYLSSYVINDSVAIDAGCLGFVGSPQQQSKVRHLFISHTHLDHIASLPIFLDNVFDMGQPTVTIYGSDAVLDTLKADLFNDRVWADFVGLSAQGVSLMKLEHLRDGRPVHVDGVTITPVSVNHVVPTHGFLIDDGTATVVIASDTGPTEEIWRRANECGNLRAVFLEASFPSEMASLAERAKHLTPAGFAVEVKKLTRPARVIAVHIKARFHAAIVKELKELNITGLEMARYGQPYCF